MYYKNKRIFVSFHHELNQQHANVIRKMIQNLGHNDITLNDGTKIENEDYKTDEQIRKEIRDKCLRNVDVTIVVIGSDSINRKHIDWEIRSTLHKFDNGRNGAIVIVNALQNNFINFSNRELFNLKKDNFEWIPLRLANSILDGGAWIPIVSYNEIKNNWNILQLAIENALDNKIKNKSKWDLNSPMKRKNNESRDRTLFLQYSA